MKQRGFSIIELLIVLVVLGILFSIGFAAIPRDRIAVNQAVERFSRDLERTRFSSISANASIDFSVDATTNGYSAVPTTGAVGGFAVADVSADFPGVRIVVVSGNPVWRFDARGVGRSTGGTVRLRFEHVGTGFSVTLDANRYGRTVRL